MCAPTGVALGVGCDRAAGPMPRQPPTASAVSRSSTAAGRPIPLLSGYLLDHLVGEINAAEEHHGALQDDGHALRLGHVFAHRADLLEQAADSFLRLHELLLLQFPVEQL